LFVVWKWTGKRKLKYYPYLQESVREGKRTKVKVTYLGPTLEAAEKRILGLDLSAEEKARLVNELHRKQPKAPPPETIEAKAAAQLRRIALRYPQDERVQRAINVALAILEGGNVDG